MTAKEIRQKFLDFFESKEHLIVPSAPIVLKNDPTLMFNNSGMAQFKDFFLGNASPPSARIADTQKCLRVTGKHNDLEDVGHDTYHHTMFEMLGNWSFGDYFKKEAIAWSWELLTEVYKLPKDRLYATVFEGDKAENLEPDHEALELWKQYLPESQILFGNKKDNFWEMGETGPCGPCSEIHIDLRPESEIKKVSGRDLVNQDDPLVIEIWNNVFMQFERMADKSLRLLPAQHVDTGMGFERLCMAVQGKTSNYDTDIFQPLIQELSKKCGIPYQFTSPQTSTPSLEGRAGEESKVKSDIALRVVSDHIRAVSFAISDGQLPSNNKAGYVIRRILRRAVRYGYSYLGFREPFMCELVPLLAEQFKEVFPELFAQKDFVRNVIREEESSFLKTLANGLDLLYNIISESKNKELSGKDVFKLYDTFGFPLDLTALIAKEKGLTIDEKDFNAEMKIQKDRARNAQVKETDDWVEVNSTDNIEFVGYDELECEIQVVKYRRIRQKDKTLYQIVLDKTPFYAESGGQVGDSGKLLLNNGQQEIKIIDTKKENDLIIHLTEDNLEEIFSSYDANSLIGGWGAVDKTKRTLITANHSATHLMHSALREVLGNHIAQKGQLVNENELRFDFSHFAKISEDDLEKIETRVNQKIRENIPLDERRNVPIKQAVEELNATALFGEKYGDFVRVITFDGDFSRELCGGTHVSNTGNIGLFKITSESSSSAGVRRIEAITSETAQEYIRTQLDLLTDLKEILKNPVDLKKAVLDLLEENKILGKQIEGFENQQVQNIKTELLGKIQNQKGINFLAFSLKLPSTDALKQLAFDLKAKTEHLFAVLAADIDGKPQIAVIISDDLVKEKNYHAGNLIKEFAKEIKGGGGGQPFFATAGGKDLEGLDKVVVKAKEWLDNVSL
jgi:alanyl-tRNA synthetase